MESDSLRGGSGRSCLDPLPAEIHKVKNQLSLNFLHQSLIDKDRLNPQMKEELKETIIEKLDKSCIPNFINESEVHPDSN
jgi:hypothetical protein